MIYDYKKGIFGNIKMLCEEFSKLFDKVNNNRWEQGEDPNKVLKPTFLSITKTV